MAKSKNGSEYIYILNLNRLDFAKLVTLKDSLHIIKTILK